MVVADQWWVQQLRACNTQCFPTVSHVVSVCVSGVLCFRCSCCWSNFSRHGWRSVAAAQHPTWQASRNAFCGCQQHGAVKVAMQDQAAHRRAHARWRGCNCGAIGTNGTSGANGTNCTNLHQGPNFKAEPGPFGIWALELHPAGSLPWPPSDET